MNSLLTSCVQEPEAPRLEPNASDQLAKVKSWFEENKTNLRLPERGSNFRTESQELILPFFEKEPDWDQFHHYYFPDGREVFEVSLENATKYFPTSMLDSFPDRDPAELVIQNILFVKHPTQERFDPLIARYYPDGVDEIEEFAGISYGSIPLLWSGRLELFTYDERFFVGFRILEGELDHSYQYQVHEGDKKLDYSRFDIRCTITYYPVGYKTCAGGTCHTTIERMVGVTSCSGSSGINSGGNYGFPSGGGPSSTGGATDGNGTCSSCYDPPQVPAPSPNLRIQIDKSFSDNAYLNCILGKLQLTKFVERLALFDGTIPNGRNVILKVGEVPKRPGQMTAANAETSDDLGPYHIQITINKDRVNLSSLELARIILHEIVHAELFVANFHKGGSSIDGNFEANFNTYIQRHYGEGNSVVHHNYMAENIVNKMATTLSLIHSNLGKQQFLNHPETKMVFQNGFDSNFYKGLAWKGLHSTDMWKYNLPERNSFEQYQDLANAALSNDCN
ncbi:hypothetical protein [Algoriphagus taiwanensis]